MLPIITQAAENFCIHQIRVPHALNDTYTEKRTLIAYIDIETGKGENHRAFIGCDHTLIQKIAEIFLGEEMSDEETLIDMLLETTNMIVGSAKVLASELYSTTMKISTPFFLHNGLLDTEVDALQSISINDGEMVIALKGL